MKGMTPGPQFVTAEGGEESAPHKLTKLAPLDAYIAEYLDGQAVKQVRICFSVPGSDAVFVLNEKIGAHRIATTATGWFQKAVTEKLGELEPVPVPEGGSAMVPTNAEVDEEGVASV